MGRMRVRVRVLGGTTTTLPDPHPRYMSTKVDDTRRTKQARATAASRVQLVEPWDGTNKNVTGYLWRRSQSLV